MPDLKEQVLHQLRDLIDRCSYTDLEKIREMLGILDSDESQQPDTKDNTGFVDKVFIEVGRPDA